MYISLGRFRFNTFSAERAYPYSIMQLNAVLTWLFAVLERSAGDTVASQCSRVFYMEIDEDMRVPWNCLIIGLCSMVM